MGSPGWLLGGFGVVVLAWLRVAVRSAVMCVNVGSVLPVAQLVIAVVQHHA